MLKQLVIIVALISFGGAFTLAQDQTSTDKKEKKECEKNCCSGHSSHDSMTMANIDSDSTHSIDHQMKTSSADKSSIVREGEIDLAAIDVNKDGKVYQDMMDWNVISDKPGECPLCGMKLKGVSIESAKENLLKHNFKLKE